MCAILAPAPAAASVDRDLPALCEAAARQAAGESGVPVDVLRAITLTETGRSRGGRHRPWPWTVNMEGTGKYFDTPEAALSYVQRHYDRGARSFDVGCFQINYRWHGQAFASIPAMFDPLTNARYAARFLRRLHGETGDWSRAAGAYHSRTKGYADKYRARFDRIRARLGKEPAPAPAEAAPPVVRIAAAPPAATPKPPTAPDRTPPANGFPLLTGEGRRGALGSLVPLGGPGVGSLLARR